MLDVALHHLEERAQRDPEEEEEEDLLQRNTQNSCEKKVFECGNRRRHIRRLFDISQLVNPPLGGDGNKIRKIQKEETQLLRIHVYEVPVLHQASHPGAPLHQRDTMAVQLPG